MEKTKESGLAIAGLILGIIGVVLAFIPFINFLAFIMGLLALIFGIIVLAKKLDKGKGIASLLLGICTLFLIFNINGMAINILSNAINEEGVLIDNNTGKKIESKKINVGETATTKNLKITFKSTGDYAKYNSYLAPKTGNKIIRAEFLFENTSDSDVVLNNFQCYADGEKYDSYYYVDDYKSPTLESISSGKKLTAIVYYEVPKNAKNIILEYETNIWTDSKIEFIVK